MVTISIEKYFFDELINNHFMIHLNEPLLLFCDGETLKCSKTWDRYISLLSDEMKFEIKKYKQWQDQKNYLVGRILCYIAHHLILGEKLNFKNWEKEEFGKPYIMNSDFRFNISHSRSQVVCLASKNHVFGIDLEEIKLLKFNEFNNHFTHLELSQVEILGASHFYKLWTIKEALIKCLGKTLGKIPLKNIVINEDLSQVNYKNHTFFTKLSAYKNFIYCIASSPEIKNFRQIEVTL